MKDILTLQQPSLAELINIEEIRSLFESFSAATGFTTGLVEHDTQQLLIGTGWQEICVGFHRRCPATAEQCRVSNLQLTAGANKSGEIRIRECLGGLIDGYTPIIIQGKHYADLYSGQILFNPPDVKAFQARADEFGFPAEAYLQSLAEVPIVTEAQFTKVLKYLAKTASLIVQQGLNNLKAYTEKEQNETLLQNLLASVPAGIGLIANREIQWTNQRMHEMVGYKAAELEKKNARMLYFTDAEFDRVGEKKYRQLAEHGTGSVDTLLKKKDGTPINVQLCSTPLDSNNLAAGVVFSALDITERKKAEIDLLKIHKELETRVQDRTASLKESNQILENEIQERKRSEQTLLQTELSLEKQRAALEEANITLKVLMRESEIERKEFEERISANLLGLVEPYLQKLKNSSLDQRQENYLEIIEASLKNLVSPFVRATIAMDLKLTPTEIQIATLIKQDRSSKEIAELLHISIRTVDKHRDNIRKKLGISGKKTNLKSYLKTRERVN